MPDFELVTDFKPTGDQPDAIEGLVKWNNREAVLRTLSMEAFFEPPVTQECIAAIVGHVEEICWEWRWQ